MAAVVLVALAAFILPGLVLATLFQFSFFLMVDRNPGVVESVRISSEIVRRRGFLPNLLLCFLTLAITFGTTLLVPSLGWVMGWFIGPLAWFILASAYIQQVRERREDLADLFPAAFPVVGLASASSLEAAAASGHNACATKGRDHGPSGQEK